CGLGTARTDRQAVRARLPRALLRAARRSAAARRRHALAGARAVRQLLSLRLAGVRRRPRGAAAAAGRGRAALGDERRLPRRLRRRAGGTRAAVHLLGLSRRRDEDAADRLARRGALPRRGVSALVPARVRRAAVLGGV